MSKHFLIYAAAMFASLLFLLLMALIFVNSTEVACQRQADATYTCEVQTLLLGEFPTFSKEITQVVAVDTFDDGCNDGCGYRVEFITADGERAALNEVYTDYNPVAAQTADLKCLLQNGQARFEYTLEPTWWLLYMLGGIFIVDAVVLTLTLGGNALKSYLAHRDELE